MFYETLAPSPCWSKQRKSNLLLASHLISLLSLMYSCFQTLQPEPDFVYNYYVRGSEFLFLSDRQYQIMRSFRFKIGPTLSNSFNHLPPLIFTMNT